MKDTVMIFSQAMEYDFLSGWIKYNRIEQEISQEALAYGICSTSHLSYFENGKKRLRGDIIEALLQKLKIHDIVGGEDIGLIRQKFYKMAQLIESFDYEIPSEIYQELQAMEGLIKMSPYNIEFKIYQLLYEGLVQRRGYLPLSRDIDLLDKIYSSLNPDLQHLYMLITGKIIYDFKDHREGIRRFEESHKIKETPWINYRLGVAYCLDHQHLKASYFLENALSSYEGNGGYFNALQCHSFLATCYIALKLFNRAEGHLNTLLRGSDFFNIPKGFWGVYNGFANLYLAQERFEECMEWSQMAMRECPEGNDNGVRWTKAMWNGDFQPIVGATYYIEACINLNRIDEAKVILTKYYIKKHEKSFYYPYLEFLHLWIFHFEDELFYKRVTDEILPYYKRIGFLNICKKIQLKLIEYLEKKRRYKEANGIYRELLNTR